MSRKLTDKTGQVFSRLAVLCRDVTRKGNVYWHCLCRCGIRCAVNSSNLNSGRQQSCGCLQNEVRVKLPPGEAAFNKLLDRYIRGAVSRNLEWALTREEFRAMVTGHCYYCGVPPSTSMFATGQRFNGDFLYNGLDRMNNDVGYVKDNLVICCPECNWAKGTRPYDQFEAWIERVLLYRKGMDVP